MNILADKVQQIFNTGVIIDNEIINLIKNYPVIINESNLSSDFIIIVETILKRSLTEDELEKISEDGCVEEIVENMLDEIKNYAHHYINQNSLK